MADGTSTATALLPFPCIDDTDTHKCWSIRALMLGALLLLVWVELVLGRPTREVRRWVCVHDGATKEPRLTLVLKSSRALAIHVSHLITRSRCPSTGSFPSVCFSPLPSSLQKVTLHGAARAADPADILRWTRDSPGWQRRIGAFGVDRTLCAIFQGEGRVECKR